MKEVLKELFSLQDFAGSPDPQLWDQCCVAGGVLVSEERPLCSTLLYSLDTKPACILSFLEQDSPLSWFWITMTAVDFWPPIWTIRDTLESTSNNQLSSASLKALLGYLKYIEVSSWG